MTRREFSSLALAGLVSVTVGCNTSGPAAPTANRPERVTRVTVPVQGRVVSENGESLAGARVSVHGDASAPPIMTDASGQFSIPALTFTTLSPTRYTVSVTAYLPGYQSTIQTIPLSDTGTSSAVAMELRMRVVAALTEDSPVTLTLTNSDPDYGSDANIPFGLPGARGPVRVMLVQPRSDGPVAIRAEWDGPDSLRMWVEQFYRETSFEAVRGPGNSLLLQVPAGWATDAMNPTVLSIGLLRESRATGGLSGPVPIRLTVRPLA